MMQYNFNGLLFAFKLAVKIPASHLIAYAI